MLVGHFLIPAATFFVPEDFIIRASALAVLIFMLTYSLYGRARGGYSLDLTFGILASMVLIALCFVGVHLGYGFLAVTYPILIVVIILGSEIYSRMTKVDASLEVISRTSAQPVGLILRFDHKMMLVLAVVLILFTLVSRVVLVDPLLEQISRIRLPSFEFTGAPLPAEPVQADEIPENPMEFMVEEQREPHLIWHLLEFIMQLVTALILLSLLIVGLVNAYMLMEYRKRKTLKLEGGDEKAFIIPELVKKSRRNLRSLPWQENKTRRLFRKKIMRYRKMGVPIIQSDTPTQMAKRIEKEDIRDLAADYEKVRY